MGNTTAHIVYRTSGGTIVPGVTTVLNVLNKPALVPWANKLGLQGIDSSKYVDDKAAIGTLAHYMILSHLQRIEPDTSDYTPKQIDQAETCLLKYWDWEKAHTLTTVLSEVPLVSDSFGFGGTIDWHGQLDDHSTLLDFKTGAGIYPETGYQLAAYNQLLREHKYLADNCQVLRIGRNPDEGFEVRSYPNLTAQWSVFLHCLGIYTLQKRR